MGGGTRFVGRIRFMAHLVVGKCCDSIPLYRLERQFKRLGVPMSRSTMTPIFDCVGGVLTPLATRIVAIVAASDGVHLVVVELPVTR